MSPSNEQHSRTESAAAAAAEVGRHAVGALQVGLRVGGRVGGSVLGRLRGLAVSPGTRGNRPSDPPGTSGPGPEVPGGSLDVTPADVAARVAPRPAGDASADGGRTPRSVPGDRLPPRRPAPAPDPVRPADS